MFSDAALLTGKPHLDKAQPCQDYALAGVTGELVWAALSDGCSQRGRTDVGARLWVQAAKQLLERQGIEGLTPDPACGATIRELARPMLQPFEFADGFATLAVTACDQHKVRVALWGDGHVILKGKDGSVCQWQVRFTANAPKYLSYGLHEGLEDTWCKEFGDQEVVVTRTSSIGEAPETALHPGRTWSHLFMEFPRDTVQGLLLVSDGLESVEELPAEQLARELLQVKSPVGAFMQRRLATMARGWRSRNEAGPRDDLSVAALWSPE